MATQKVKYGDYQLERDIERIIRSNCETEPYEGDTIYTSEIIKQVMELLTISKEYSLLRHKPKQ
jgi:hypothetical protein